MIKHRLKLLARKFGLEVSKYAPANSKAASLKAQLALHDIDCVVDVGANVGQYVQFLRELGYAGNVISFEPQTIAHKALTEASSSDPYWHVAARMGLGERESELQLNIAGNSASSSLLGMLDAHSDAAPYSKICGTEMVCVKRLDSLSEPMIEGAERIFLKIDTQGYEIPVLLGAEGIMQKVAGLQLEMSIIPLYEGQELYQEILHKLEDAGFELWGIEPGFCEPKTGRLLQFDGIFFRK